MRTHSANFKNQIKLLGKQQEIQIIYGSTTLTGANINSATYYLEGDLLKSIMKGFEIDSNVDIPLNTEIILKYGLYVNSAYEYINLGKYIVKSSEKQEDTNSYLINCYDKMLFSMKNYDEDKLTVSYPITIRNYLQAICTKLGLTFASAGVNFANYNKLIPSDLFETLGYTYRDILDDLSEVTASCICINENGSLEVRYVNNTNDTINESYLKDVNINFGKKYGPINSIVLSRSAESDNVYLRDEQSVTQNGLCEIKIKDNVIMNFNDRSQYLQDILNKLDGLEYYINDFKSTGIIYYDILDMYNVQIGNDTYKCLMLNDEIDITQGLEESIYTKEPEISVTDYTKADKTDQRINKTTLIVDKQAQEIEGLVETTEEIQEEVEDIKDTISTATGNPIYIEDSSNNNIIELIEDGKCEQDITTGKNKINLPSSYSLTGAIYDNPITLPAGTYTLSLKSAVNGGTSQYFLMIFKDGDGHILYKPIYFNNLQATFTLAFNATKFNLYSQQDNASSIGITTIFNEMMIETGGTKTPYEPYTGGTPSPNPSYPQEVETVKGRNLWDNSNYITNISTGLEIKNGGFEFTRGSQTGGKYVAKKIHVEQGKKYIFKANYSFVGTGNYIVLYRGSVYGTQVQYVYAQSMTYVSTANEDLYFTFIIGSNTTSGVATEIQVEKGSSTPYIPYNTLGIDVVGNNLIDIADYSGTLTGYYAQKETNYLLKANTQYTLSCDLTISQLPVRIGVCCGLNSYTTDIGNAEYNTVSNRVYVTFTPTSTQLANGNKLFIRCPRYTTSVSNVTYSVKNIMLVKGTDTTYEPHQSNTTLINLQGNELCEDDKLVIKETGEVSINKKTYKRIYDGSDDETWVFYPDKTHTFRLYLGVTSVKGLCSHYSHVPASKFDIDTGIYLLQSNSVIISDIRFSTVADFKAELARNPITVYYVLATSEEIPLHTADNPITLPRTYKNISHISGDNTMTVTYYRDNGIEGYATKQETSYLEQRYAQLKITDEAISTEVASTKSSLNNYYTKNEADSKITSDINDESARLSQIIQENKTSIEQTASAIDIRVGSIETNGVNKVTTETGFTFNKDGLTISKEGAKTSSTLDEEGLSVKDNNGNDIHYSGYISDTNIFNLNNIQKNNGASITINGQEIKVKATVAGTYKYSGILLGESELLGKQVTLSGEWIASASNLGYLNLYFGNSSSPAITPTGITLGTSGGQSTGTIASTFPTNCDKVWLLLYANTSGTSQIDDYVTYSKVQVEYGSTKTEYKQHSKYGGQTITKSTNLVAENYLILDGASRFEPYSNPVLGGHGTGVFDIGGGT